MSSGKLNLHPSAAPFLGVRTDNHENIQIDQLYITSRSRRCPKANGNTQNMRERDRGVSLTPPTLIC